MMNKILLADNQEMFRIGMAKILAREEDLRLAAQCADLERLLLSVDAYRSSIVLFASALRPEYQDLMASVKAAGSRAVVIAENGEPAHSFIAHDIRGVVYRNMQGCKNKEIAVRLGTNEQVVKNYLRSIYDKTGVSDRLELALFTTHNRILA